MKNGAENRHDRTNDIMGDIGKYRSHIFLVGLFVFLLHSAKLNSNVIGIDTEDLIHLGRDFYGGWLATGRQGLVFLKYFLGNSYFDPYFAGAMTLIMFTLAAAAFFLLWDRVGGRSGETKRGLAAWGLGGLLWVSHPILVEQFYFSLQSMEICLCFVLTAAALYLSFLWVENRKRRGYILQIIAVTALLFIVFSSYQIFVVLYIFGVITILLLQSLTALGRDAAVPAGELWKKAGVYAALFLTAFVLNMAVTGIFFSTSDYLQQQIMWGEGAFSDNIRNILHHIRQVLTGADSIFYHWTYGLLCVTSFLLLLLVLRQHRRQRKGSLLMVVFLYLAAMAMPFLMTVVVGGIPVVRSQLILPVMTGFLAYLNVILLRQVIFPGEKAALCAAAVLILICGAGSLEQARMTGALYYTDRCRYEQDAAIARQLIRKLQVVNRWNLPVAVVGSLEFEPNNACVQGEIIGRSFFDYDTEVEPLNYWSTRRVLGFFHILGADYEQLHADRMEEALTHSTYMAMWPEDNCIEMCDDFAVIKLSDF